MPTHPARPAAAVLLPLAAAGPEEVGQVAGRAEAAIASLDAAAPGDAALTALTAFDGSPTEPPGAWRAAVVGSTVGELRRRLADLAAGTPGLGTAGPARAATAPALAFVCSGQGPQWWGMGRELLAGEPAFRDAVAEVDARFRRVAGWSILEELGRDEAESRVPETEVAQPALFALQVGLAAWWADRGVHPAVLVGHSVGEVAAAHLAGVLDLDDAVRVIAHRGRLMQRATGGGRMAAVDLDPAALAPYLEATDGRVSLGAVNAPASVTVAGDPEAVDALIVRLKAEGVTVRALQVTYAFHSPQMDALQPDLLAALEGLTPRPARIPLVSTLHGAPAGAGDYGPRYWSRQMREPVAFAGAIAHLVGSGVRTFLELAPHPVLAPSIDQALRRAGVEGVVASSLRRAKPELPALLAALGELWVHGVPAGVTPSARPVARPPAGV